MFRITAEKLELDRRCCDYALRISTKDTDLAQRMDTYILDMEASGMINRDSTVMNSPIFPLLKDKEKGKIRPIYVCRALNEKILSKRSMLPI